MKIVITGANGQLGLAFQSLAPEAIALSQGDLDFTNSDDHIRDVIRKHKPNVLLNCAAHTHADKAEIEPELAFRINTEVVKVMAETCAELGAQFITYSSDYVFDGSPKHNGYSESDATAPLSIYGKTKADMEKAIADIPKATTIRTSWVFGTGDNFARTMLKLADKGLTNLTVVNDQIGRPTYAPDLAATTLKLLKQGDLPRIIHVTNEGESVSWADYAKEIFAITRRDVTVTPISTVDYYKDKTGYAERPHYSVLNLDLLHSRGITLRPWDEALKEYLQ